MYPLRLTPSRRRGKGARPLPGARKDLSRKRRHHAPAKSPPPPAQHRPPPRRTTQTLPTRTSPGQARNPPLHLAG
ncbi:hypothetical protein CSE45_4232 [Citreicella sp. SE45]|nr:hypothetical protein CSE45_4232 [Citreicella sp. SE45]